MAHLLLVLIPAPKAIIYPFLYLLLTEIVISGGEDKQLETRNSSETNTLLHANLSSNDEQGKRNVGRADYG